MIEISTTATFDRLFKKLPLTIQRKAATKTDRFKSNPFHPSLHTEKLHPKHHEVWSFRVDQAYRIIFKMLMHLTPKTATACRWLPVAER